LSKIAAIRRNRHQEIQQTWIVATQNCSILWRDSNKHFLYLPREILEPCQRRIGPMMKYAPFLLYTLMALTVILAGAWAYHSFFGDSPEWKKMADEQQRQILSLQQINAEQGKLLSDMADQLSELADRLRMVDKTASDGIYLIKKMRKETEQRNEEISHMSDAELDAIIKRGIARYRAERGQAGPGPTD
jgi:signal transduction histidine kinase